jgi:hypothetical protein
VTSSGATVVSPLITLDTVFRLTPANPATSRIVGRARSPARWGGAGETLARSSDNVFLHWFVASIEIA